MNYVKTAALLAFMTALFMGVGFMLAGESGMLIALVVAAGMNVFAWWRSGDMVLSMHGAREVGPRDAPQLYELVEELAQNAGLPMPKVYIIDTDQPNAFATGRSPEHSAVAATRGLLDRLTPEEVAGVMAHELAHIQNRDTLIMTITATLAGAIAMLANFAMFFRGDRNNPFGFIGMLAAMIVAPLAAGLVQMAISRTREYAADRRGAEICGAPGWLASALDKIARGAKSIPNPAAERAPATAHMFIVNPLMGEGFDNLFSTHPDTDNRIAALRAMAQEMPPLAAPPSAPAPAPRHEPVAAPERAARPAPRPRRPVADEETPRHPHGPWGRRPERPRRTSSVPRSSGGRAGPWN